MIVLVLSIILVGLSILEKRIYIKKTEDWNKVRLLMAILLICLLFSISYLITDTAIGVFYVFSSMATFVLIGIISHRSNMEWFKYSSHIIGIPVMIYLLIKAIQNMLIHPQYIFLLLLVMNLTVDYSYKRKWSKRENIALAIGIVMGVALIFSYYKLSGSEDRIMVKQELVAQKYLEEELGMYGLTVYADNYSIKLRGEDATVTAYDSSDTFIIMIYNNNKIISYYIKNN